MNKRNDGRWRDSVRLEGMKEPKYFYGKRGDSDRQQQADIKRQIAEWSAAKESGPLLSSLADKWLADHGEHVDEKTVEGYAAPLKRISAEFEGQYAKNITPGQIQAFINSLKERGYKRTTVQRPLDVLRMVFDYGILNYAAVLKSNPCAAVKLPSGLEQERRELADPADIQRIKDSVNFPFGLFAYLMIYTGFRKGEALALRREDFDMDAGTISVTKEVSWKTNQPKNKPPKTPKSIRSVILLDPLRAALPETWSGYLFSADGGKSPLSQTEFRHRWNTYCQKAGLADPEIVSRKTKVKSALKNQNGVIERTYSKTVWHYHLVPHQFRHEFATLCLDAGLDDMDTQEMMGHAKIETTRAIYQHIRESRRKKTGSKLNDYVNGVLLGQGSIEGQKTATD